MRSTFFAVIALAIRATAQSTNATQLAIIDAQYTNTGFTLDPPAGFGIELKSTALLTVHYEFGDVVNGNTYTTEQVAQAPTVFITPETEFPADTKYTLMLADASALGDPDPRGNYRHFLANGLTGSGARFEPTGGNIITNYAGPGPLPNSGLHRYAWLLFTEPATFTAPSNLSSYTNPGPISVKAYAEAANITLVAASFFAVDAPGEPSGSVVPTTAVDTAAIAAAASTQQSSGGSAGGSQTSGASNPATTSSGSSDAGKIMASLSAGIAALGAFALA